MILSAKMSSGRNLARFVADLHPHTSGYSLDRVWEEVRRLVLSPVPLSNHALGASHDFQHATNGVVHVEYNQRTGLIRAEHHGGYHELDLVS